MEISDSIVGRELGQLSREISWRDTMNFAAGVGDESSVYRDDTVDGALGVHPLFPVAVSWPFIENAAQRFADLLPAEVIPRMVHGSEHLVWHNRLVPGEQLLVSGRVAAVYPLSVGTMVVMLIQAQGRNGQPIFSEYIGGLFRGVDCAGPGRGADALPLRPATGAQGPVWTRSRELSPIAAQVYDGCTNIVFAIHTSRAFARFVGLPDLILHGTASLAMAVSELVRQEADGDPARVTEVGCSFRKPVIPGHPIHFDLMSREGVNGYTDLSFAVRNHLDQVAISDGFVRLKN